MKRQKIKYNFPVFNRKYEDKINQCLINEIIELVKCFQNFLYSHGYVEKVKISEVMQDSGHASSVCYLTSAVFEKEEISEDDIIIMGGVLERLDTFCNDVSVGESGQAINIEFRYVHRRAEEFISVVGLDAFKNPEPIIDF